MALDVKKLSFAANTSTGDQVVSGVGFQPKAVLFWGNRLTATGYGTGLGFFFGAATSSSQRWAMSIYSDDAAASSNTGRHSSDTACISILLTGTPTQDAIADFVSFGSDGFTINWSDAPASAWLIHALCLGGSEISNAFAGDDLSDTVVSTQAYTGVGFQPTFLLFGSISIATIGTLTANANLCIGMASSASAEGVTAFRDRDAQPSMAVAQRQRSDFSIQMLSNSAGGASAAADFVSFDSDGFTLNWSTVDAAAPPFFYLALKGGQHKVGIETQALSATTKATTGVGFAPSGLFVTSAGAITNTGVDQTQARMTVGASDGTTEGHTWIQSLDAAADSDVDSRTVTDKVLGMSTQPSTTSAEADLQSFDTDGFTLNWSTADAVAREFVYWAFGGHPSLLYQAPVGPPPSLRAR